MRPIPLPLRVGLLVLLSLATRVLSAGRQLGCTAPPFTTYAFCNASLPLRARVDDAVARMSLDEKLRAMTGAFGSPFVECAGGGSFPSLGVEGLPNHAECLHGVAWGCHDDGNGTRSCPTLFPNGMMLGASFNRTAWRGVGSTIGDEMRALRNLDGQPSGFSCWSPDLNIARDPRWGRAQEVRAGGPGCARWEGGGVARKQPHFAHSPSHATGARRRPLSPQRVRCQLRVGHAGGRRPAVAKNRLVAQALSRARQWEQARGRALWQALPAAPPRHAPPVPPPHPLRSYDLEGLGPNNETGLCTADTGTWPGAHGYPNGGPGASPQHVCRYNYNGTVSDRDLVEFYLPAWHAIFTRSHAHGMMVRVSTMSHPSSVCWRDAAPPHTSRLRAARSPAPLSPQPPPTVFIQRC